ncbi:MAG TPA: hypothetical protein VKE93_19890 [Candidatus Angelobacter sp.]|nr:hypothetical protein [Candidatus Angelobacter sp.]
MVNRSKQLLLLTTMALAVLAGCRTVTTIADINRDPGRFTGKEITISGKVSDAFGGLGNGVFAVDDGTGKIWVFSQNFGIPAGGGKVTVTGQVQQGFNFGGRNYGLIFRETKPRD